MAPSPNIRNLRFGDMLEQYRMRVEEHLLRKDEELLIRLDDVIAFHEELLKKMTTERGLLYTNIWERRSLKAPMRTLPTELVQKILLLACVDEEATWSDRPVYPVALFGRLAKILPNDLAGVCARWHHIVYDTPQFWEALTVKVPRSESQKNRLQQILDRSRSRPLSLSIQRGSWYQGVSSTRFIAPLRQAMSRASELHIDYDFIAEEYLGEEMEYSALKSLSLYMRGSYGVTERYPFSSSQLRLLIRAPALESFWTDSFREMANHSLFPSDTITEFACGQGGILGQEDVSKVFGNCPRIRVISITLKPSSQRPDGSSKPLVLHHLERLTYSSDGPRTIAFLDSLTTPSLQELNLPLDAPSNVHQHFVQFLERSRCSLRTLGCTLPRELTADPSGWGTILSRLHDLDTLRVRVSGSQTWSGKSSFDILCDVLSTDVPTLRKLKCFQVTAHGGDWRDLQTSEMDGVMRRWVIFAESRSPQHHKSKVVPLRKTRLQFDSNRTWSDSPDVSISADLKERRELLVSAGMECELFLPFD
ncbi:hypothetical protein V5O48_007704 [Marasmius crinis-equi]|uniref:F-box domain-containing protein n=1 Tax=Marasmius crinis-equi TaxID=585013 RepID=A0ABR3FGE6_9AGAR